MSLVYSHQSASMDRDRATTLSELGPTLMRVPLGLALLFLIAKQPYPGGVACLTVFILWDVLDGVLARRTNADSSRRVIADGVIDRISACSCLLLGAFLYSHRALPLVVILVCREVWLGMRNLRLLRSGIIMKATKIHKATSLGYGLLGYAILLVPGMSFEAAVVATLISALLTRSYVSQQLCLRTGGACLE